MKKFQVVKVYHIFDQLYLDKEKALLVEEDWGHKERIKEGYSIFDISDFEGVMEIGSIPCDRYSRFYETRMEALEDLEELKW